MADNDSGGIGAKKGFLYQDYVAALYTLKMLTDKNVIKIRCEVGDDIDIVYNDRIEYVQVKSTKADKSWQLGEFTKVTSRTEKSVKGKNKKVKNKDSILHKSINCDNGELPAHFRIVTPRGVNKALSYLTIPKPERLQKKGRDSLLKSLFTAVKNHLSPNGCDVEYWLDNASWEVLPTIEQIELAAFKEIITVAHEYCGVFLIPSREPDKILNDLLINLIQKSATSIVLRSEDKKVYTRNALLTWFKEEVKHYNASSHKQLKIYTTDQAKLTAILSTFFVDDAQYAFNGEKSCYGLNGKYHRRVYGYDNITQGIKRWLPEVLLLPSEIADHLPEKLEEKIQNYTNKKALHRLALDSLIAKVLLHSTVRTSYGSQPIPARLYIDDAEGSSFDNIHILINDHEPDLLLMGFSYLIKNEITDHLKVIVENFDKMLESSAFISINEKILEEKEDGYLLKHDVDEILDANSSLDEHLARFRFAFFLGYETNILECAYSETPPDHLEILKEEVTTHFQELIDHLVLQDAFFKDLNIQVYLYPVPSLDKLKNAVQGIV